VLHHVGAQLVADRVSVPAGLVQQPLHPIRRALTSVLGQVPAVLAVDLAEQALQVGQGAAARLGPTKPPSDPGMQSIQLPSPPLDLSRIGVWHLSHPAS
jgi:hypothetical protein